MTAEPHPLRCETCMNIGCDYHPNLVEYYRAEENHALADVITNAWVAFRQCGCASHSSAKSSDHNKNEKQMIGVCDVSILNGSCPICPQYLTCIHPDKRMIMGHNKSTGKVLDDNLITEIIGTLTITEGFVPTAIRSEVMRLRERLVKELRQQQEEKG